MYILGKINIKETICMRKKNSFLGIFLIALIFLMSSCVADIDGKYKGFSSGFNYGRPRT